MGTMALHSEQYGEQREGHRHDPGREGRGDELEAFHRTEDRDGGGDDGISVKQSCAEEPDGEQDGSAAFCGKLVHGQYGDGEEPAFAAVIRPQNNADVFDGYYKDERPRDGCEDAVDVGGVDVHAQCVETLPQGIEGGGADVSEHDAEG